MTFFSETRPAPRTGRRPALSRILSVWRQRQKLRDLDDRMLDDIGVSRQQALTEAHRPLWELPAQWMR